MAGELTLQGVELELATIPPPEPSLEAMGAGLEAERKREEKPPPTPRKISNVQLRLGFADPLFSGGAIDSFQPASTLASIPDWMQATPTTAPLSSVYLNVTPGDQEPSPRVGIFAVYRNLRGTQEKDGNRQETTVHQVGAGLSLSVGPLIGPKLGGAFESVFQPSENFSWGLAGLQVSTGVAVADVRTRVTRPDGAVERARILSFSALPFYAEAEMKFLYLEFFKHLQVQAGLNSAVFLQEASLELGSSERQGNFRLFDRMTPTVTVGWEL